MLRVIVDMFSGRPNPEWIITDPDVVDELIGAATEAKGVTARPGAGFTGLGFREVRVSRLSDDPLRRRRGPREFAVGTVAAEDIRASVDLALRFVATMDRARDITLVAHELTPLTTDLRDLIRQRIERVLVNPGKIFPLIWPPYNPLRTTIPDDHCENCEYEVSQFNPGFWNTPAVQPNNNCYNYARNWRTDTFAQPGRAHGAKWTALTCPNVATAAMADGLVKRCNCLPIEEWPRRLVALVMDPGGDYHWMRHQRGGFWGHKPGGGTARNFDNSGNVITNPETCDRGDYIEFCEYFYAGRSVVIN